MRPHFSVSMVSTIVRRLDLHPEEFVRRRLEERSCFLILCAHYERVREDGVIGSQAVLMAPGIDWDGRHQVPGVEPANRESRSSWEDFLLDLKDRRLDGVGFVVSNAISKIHPQTSHQPLLPALSEERPGPHATQT